MPFLELDGSSQSFGGSRFDSYQSPPFVPPPPGPAPTVRQDTSYGLPFIPGPPVSAAQAAARTLTVAATASGPFGGFLGGYAPSMLRGARPRGATISYIGPTVSARPRFNVDFRKRRLRDLFSR